MKKVFLSNISKYAIVDDEDFEKINKHKWRDNGFGVATRVATTKDRKKITVFMHREILNYFGKTKNIDHINRNPLDNRRINLRICTVSENLFNRPAQKNNKSGYKGVSWHKNHKKWVAEISIDKKKMWLGEFLDKVSAARAYNKMAFKYRKDFALLNNVWLSHRSGST